MGTKRVVKVTLLLPLPFGDEERRAQESLREKSSYLREVDQHKEGVW